MHISQQTVHRRAGLDLSLLACSVNPIVPRRVRPDAEINRNPAGLRFDWRQVRQIWARRLQTFSQRFFRFVSGSFFSDLLFSTTWPALFPVCFSSLSFIFNNFGSFVSGLFPVCFFGSSFVFNNFPGLFFKKEFFFSRFSVLGSTRAGFFHWLPMT